MGNACTNCSACKGDMGENSEVLTVDNKVSRPGNHFKGCCYLTYLLYAVVRFKTNRRATGK